jgi:hypothetical protein
VYLTILGELFIRKEVMNGKETLRIGRPKSESEVEQMEITGRGNA